MPASANEAVVLQAIEAVWNCGDLDAADNLFGDDYINHYGLITDLIHGPEAIKISAAMYRLAFPRLHVTVEEVRTDDETVVLRWTARANSDESMPVASTTGALTGVTRSRVAAGKIVESWTEWDRVGVLRSVWIDRHR
jgi:predicted SnoaL-like aldol condensation-catalyzing enzyme